jgi:hypothetical protein
MVIALAFGPKVCGFNPAQDDILLRALKSVARWRGSKAVGPMS